MTAKGYGGCIFLKGMVLVLISVPDWQGRSLIAAKSKGGVISFADYDAQLMRPHPGSIAWPPACIVQKLYASEHSRAFDPQDLSVLQRRLGYYTDLQSVHSEDVMTYNYFGLLSCVDAATRAHFSNWLISQLGVQWKPNTKCTVSLWRRIPHPDTHVPGGPELDALIQGDSFVVFVEAKWCSPEGSSQGKQHDKGQLQLREEFLAKLGRQFFGNVQFGVLAVSLNGNLVMSSRSGSIPCWNITWAKLCTCPYHPAQPEVEDFYKWKRNLSTCA